MDKKAAPLTTSAIETNRDEVSEVSVDTPPPATEPRIITICEFDPSSVALPFSTLVVGGPGSTKTSFVFNFLEAHKGRFAYAYAWSPNPVARAHLAQVMSPDNIFDSLDESVLAEKIYNVEECRAFDGHESDKSIFIFDDFFADPQTKNSRGLQNLMKFAHHEGISVVATVHNPIDVSPSIRAYFSHVALTYSGLNSSNLKESCYQYFQTLGSSSNFVNAFDRTCTVVGQCMISVVRGENSGSVFAWKYRKIAELKEFSLLSNDIPFTLINGKPDIIPTSYLRMHPFLPKKSSVCPSAEMSPGSSADSDVSKTLEKCKTVVNLLSTSMVLVGCNLHPSSQMAFFEISHAMKMLLTDPGSFDYHDFTTKVALMNKALVAPILDVSSLIKSTSVTGRDPIP